MTPTVAPTDMQRRGETAEERDTEAGGQRDKGTDGQWSEADYDT